MRVSLTFLLLPTLLLPSGIRAAQSSQQPREAKPTLSIALSTRRSEVEVGSPLMLGFAITNTSDHDVFLGSIPTRLSVVGSDGKAVPETPHGRKAQGTEPPAPPRVGRSGTGIGAGGSAFGPPPLHPGDTIKGRRHDLSREYHLSKPGKYTIQARRWDPDSQLVVESNLLTVTLVGSPKNAEPPKTSFSLYISTDEDRVSASNKVTVNTEVTNTSDREIVHDTSMSMLDIQVRDAQGNLAPLTESGRSLRKQFGNPGSAYNQSRVKPGDTLRAGAVDVGGLYDMRRPGDYTIQVLQFDKETQTWVKSNTITVTVVP